MKKNKKILIGLSVMFLLSLTSCGNIKITIPNVSSSLNGSSVSETESLSEITSESLVSSEKITSEEEKVSSESVTNKDSSSSVSSISSDSETSNESSSVLSSISSESSSSSKESSIMSSSSSSVSSKDLSGPTLSISSSDITCGTYTNNFTYGTTNISTIGDYTFGIYRANVSSSSLQIKPDTSYYKETAYNGMDGGFYNIAGIHGIKQISVDYKYSSSNGKSSLKKAHIDFGTTSDCSSYSVDFDSSSTSQDIYVGGNDFNFFKICSGDYNFSINSVNIIYTDSTSVSATYASKSGENKYRVNPVTYTGTLTAGSSKVSVPVETSYNSSTGKMDVIKTKELTYYTYEYLEDHSSEVSAAAVTDPLEVCAYYTAFGTWPANYGLTSNDNLDGKKTMFGTSARQVSSYTKTTGYATSVPYNNYGSTGKPLYYELDIGLTSSYSTSNRDVGRVVVWEAGFSSSGYDSSPVCVYTDDHYATWLEYYNNGTWSERYNAQGNYASFSFSAPKTVTLAS